MRIITDTNIWYYLGQDKELFEKVKGEPVCPNYINIIEICKSENLIEKTEIARSAIQRMFHFKEQVIYEPPFVSIAQLTNEYKYDPVKEMGSYLQFTSDFAKGAEIEANKKDEFFKWIQDRRSHFEEASKEFNDRAESIRPKIENKKVHRSQDTHKLTADFLNFCVQVATDGKCSMNGVSYDQIELIVKTVDHFFKTIELSSMKIQPNDWFDLAILGYVRPGDKYWTAEKRWIRIIEEAGCEEYLYKI